jgi:caffeoyl-CoA O-methyltransferase
LLTFLIETLGVKRALELGVFTGYSSICVALALPADGYLLACDLSDEFTRVARRYWQLAGVSEKIELRLAPATETLSRLLNEGAQGSFDFAFIDADKENYLEYFESCLALLRKGGVLAVDNALWGGSVADPSDTSPSTSAIRALNQKAFSDPRVSSTLLPIGDGLLLVRKR